jgi:hypothetical protein
MKKTSNMNIAMGMSGGDDNEDFNFIKVNKSQNIDSKVLMNKFTKVISHDTFQNPNRIDRRASKGNGRKLLEMNYS